MYTKQSTANPNGWRPWQSRLGYYRRSAFPLPTTDMSGLGSVALPNYATFARSRTWRGRDTRNAPVPQIYLPPELSASRRRNAGGLGMITADASGGESPVMYRIDPATGGYRYFPVQTSPTPILQTNTFQPVAPTAITPMGDSVTATGTVQIQAGGQTVSVSSSPIAQPAPGGIQNSISLWMDQQMISGVPNKFLALGLGALLLMRKH